VIVGLAHADASPISAQGESIVIKPQAVDEPDVRFGAPAVERPGKR
jgi:hypothetical protein